jgi:5'-deoxynucleotidase YfbR-like HD superfamily hydrolase
VSNSVDFYWKARHTSFLNRYNGRRVIRPQTVAEHSYNVTLMAILLYNGLSKQDKKLVDFFKLITYTMTHDVSEVAGNDAHWPAKNYSKEIKAFFGDFEQLLWDKVINPPKGLSNDKVAPVEVEICKFCDMLELVYYCMEEMQCGNLTLKPIFQRGLYYIEKAEEKLENWLDAESLNVPLSLVERVRDWSFDNGHVALDQFDRDPIWGDEHPIKKERN